MNYRHSILLLVLSGYMLGNAAKDEPTTTPVRSLENYDELVYQYTKPLAELLNAVRSKYYTLPDIQKALLEGIKKVATSLDAHSDFYSPEEFKPIQESIQGEFCGIGVVIDDSKRTEHESLTIVDVLPDGPAEKAGMRAQDKIVEIEAAGLRSKSVEQVVRLLKGPQGTPVKIKVQRTGFAELIPVTIIRDIIKDQNASCYYFKEQNIFYLALNMFTENSIDHMKKLITRCQEANAQGLILDLRNNGGGLLNAVVDIAGLFLPKNSLIVSAKNREGNVVGTYATRTTPIVTKPLPIFILVNNFTASAAEILAGCLRVYAQKQTTGNNTMIFLAGCTTFGKGSVQEVMPVSNDCVIKLTVALYYLPDGTCLQARGLVPDFIIPPYSPPNKDTLWFNKMFGQEKELHNAIIPHESASKDEKDKVEDKPKSPQQRRQQHIKADYVIQSTVRLLGLLETAQKSMPTLLKDRQAALNFLKKTYILDNEIILEEIKI